MDHRAYRVVCAWCREVIFEPHPDGYTPGEYGRLPTSHGICDQCFRGQETVLAGMAPTHPHAGKVGGEG